MQTQLPNLTQPFELIVDNQLRCLRRSCGSGVRHEVREGRVSFVTDGAHDGDRAGRDSPHQTLVGEGHEIFSRTTTSTKDDHIRPGLFE